MSMIIDGTSGATFPDGSIQANAGGMTLLGTITPTAVTTLSLSGLTLTSYKSLFIAFSSIACGAEVYINSDGTTVNGGFNFGATMSGTAWLDLATGAIGGLAGVNTIGATIFTAATTGAISGLTNVSTSTTTLYFKAKGTNTFTASGSIKVYGVK